MATVGCSSTDDTATVVVPSPDAYTAKLCRKLHQQLPDELDGLERTDPEPRSELTAGWGSSAIILRCGVPKPAKMGDLTAPTTEVDGLGWLIEEPGDGSYRFTSALREAYVEVTIGSDHKKQSGAASLVVLGREIKKAIPKGIAN